MALISILRMAATLSLALVIGFSGAANCPAADRSSPVDPNSSAGAADVDSGSGVIIVPESVRLSGPDSRWQLVVDAAVVDGLTADLTRAVQYESADSEVASVSPDGLVRGLADGETTITVSVAGRSKSVPVVVSGTASPRVLHFENDIIPIFSRFGCNTSGCHGKAEGQNGFKLSIFGFDPEADRAALTQEGRGRRAFLTVPDQSLLLLKASGGMPHGGGIRIRRGSGEYRMLRDWLQSGAPMGDPDAPHVVDLRVYPAERRMPMNATQQIQVTAVYSDGREVDVTHHARFQTNVEALATVDEYGLVRTDQNPGGAAIMASYMGAVAVFRVLIPQPGDETFPQRPVHNFIDDLVDQRLRQLNIHPSELCSDADFLRRASLDITGRLPSPDQTRAFLADSSPDKRARLVDHFLQQPGYADLFALKWSDVLRVDRLALGHKQAYAYYHWIHQQFEDNTPFDEFARKVVTASGDVSENPATSLFKVVNKPGEVASTLSQVFMGVRIECAQCHHHPFDRWGQGDYVGMQAFFGQTAFKKTPSGELLFTRGNATGKHPRTGDTIQAHALLEPEPETAPEGDSREHFAAWLTDAKNPWFARNIANRMWAHLMGRGLVEPVDDARLTNPPTNPALLDALAVEFTRSGYDLHSLIRTITASRTYQLSATPNESNQHDEQNSSRALLKQLDSEVRLDMICDVTGVPEKFDGVPSGYRAVQVWDSQVQHYFLSLFGRPVRATACDCERATEPSVSQVLHVLNSPELQSRLSDAGGRLVRLRQSISDNATLVEELYLLFYSRYPSDSERESLVGYLSRSENRQQAVEDIAWSLINTPEFLFNH